MPGIHLPFEVLHGPGEERLECYSEFDVTGALLGQCLPTNDPYEVGVDAEELETGGEHMVDLRPTPLHRFTNCSLHPFVPFGECSLEHFAVHRLLCGEVVQEALALDTHLGRDHVECRAIEAALGEQMPCGDNYRFPRRSPNHAEQRSGAGAVLPLTCVTMEIIAALFIEEIDLRQVTGPATRIDLTGIQFSAAAPAPLPFTWAPHLVVIIRCPADGTGRGVLEVTYHRGDDQIARSVQPFDVEPGKFTYRLVRAEIDFEEYGTVEAHCRIDQSTHVTVPYTILPPPED